MHEHAEVSRVGDLVSYQDGGEAAITIAGRPHRLRASDLIMMLTDEPHALKAVSRFTMLLTLIRS